MNVTAGSGNSSNRGRVAGCLAFVFCLLVGLSGSRQMLVIPAMGFLRARNWTATPCVIVSCSVAGSHSSGYSMAMRYAYNVNGRRFEGTRYDWREGGGDYHDNAAVVRRYPGGSRATCYVNSADPAEAVMERGIQNNILVSMIPVLLLLIGAGGLAWPLTAGPSPSAAIGCSADPPWLRRSDWAARRIVHSSVRKERFMWSLTAICNIVAIPAAAVILPQALADGHHILAIWLVLPAIGMLLLVWAVRVRWQRQAFGDSFFELTTLPGAIGGALEGVLHLSRYLQPAGGFTFHLTCIQRLRSVSAQGRHQTLEVAIWEEERIVHGVSANNAVPVTFYISDQGLPSSDADLDNVVLWKLRVTANTPNGRYGASFDVPVFRVSQTPQQIAEARRVLAGEQADIASYQRSPHSRIRVRPTRDGGKEFDFGPCRHPGIAVAWMALVLAFSFVLWLSVPAHGSRVLVIFFGLLSLGAVRLATRSIMGRTRVTVNMGIVRIAKGLVWTGRQRIIAAADIAALRTNTFTPQFACRPYTDIHIVLKNGKRIVAGDAIADILEAEWIVRQMKEALSQP